MEWELFRSVVTLDDKLFVKLVQEYRLDWSGKNYQLTAVHEDELDLVNPLPIAVAFSELDRRARPVRPRSR